MTVWVYLKDGRTVAVHAAVTAKVVRRAVRQGESATATERVLTCRGPDGQVVEEFASAVVIGFRASDNRGDVG